VSGLLAQGVEGAASERPSVVPVVSRREIAAQKVSENEEIRGNEAVGMLNV
jgi:hypothetical protein